MLDHGREILQVAGNLGGTGGLQFRQNRQDVSQLGPLAAGRQTVPDFFVEGHQTDGILLVNHEVGQSGRETDAVVEFGQLLPERVVHAG